MNEEIIFLPIDDKFIMGIYQISEIDNENFNLHNVVIKYYLHPDIISYIKNNNIKIKCNSSIEEKNVYFSSEIISSESKSDTKQYHNNQIIKYIKENNISKIENIDSTKIVEKLYMIFPSKSKKYIESKVLFS